MGFNKVFKNSFFYTIASVLQGAMSLFLLPVYTRYLTPSDYAVLALVLSFTAIFSSVMTLQIESGISRFVIKFIKDEERAKIYFSSIFILTVSLLLFGCAAINIFGDNLLNIILSKNNKISYAPFFQIATWAILPALLVNSGLLLLQTLEKGMKYLLVILAQVVVNISCGLFFVVFLKTGLIGVIWAQFISAVCGLFFIVWLIKDWIQLFFKFPAQDIKDSLKYSLPIIPHMIGIYIYMYSDKLVLQRYVSLEDIGVYAVAGTLAYVLLVIVNSTTAAYGPRFLKLAEDNKSKAQDETMRFIGLWWGGVGVIFMGYVLFSDIFVKIMTRPSFYPAIPLIPILASAYIFRGLYCFSVNSVFFCEKTKFIPIITISAAMINIALNIIFIPKYGIFAAAWNSVISYFITFVLAYCFSKRYFPVIYPWKSMADIVLLFLSACAAVKVFDSIAPPADMIPKLYFNAFIFILFVIADIFIVYKSGFMVSTGGFFKIKKLLKRV